jgi:hypothetical protein
MSALTDYLRERERRDNGVTVWCADCDHDMPTRYAVPVLLKMLRIATQALREIEVPAEARFHEDRARLALARLDEMATEGDGK